MSDGRSVCGGALVQPRPNVSIHIGQLGSAGGAGIAGECSLAILGRGHVEETHHQDVAIMHVGNKRAGVRHVVGDFGIKKRDGTWIYAGLSWREYCGACA